MSALQLVAKHIKPLAGLTLNNSVISNHLILTNHFNFPEITFFIYLHQIFRCVEPVAIASLLYDHTAKLTLINTMSHKDYSEQ